MVECPAAHGGGERGLTVAEWPVARPEPWGGLARGRLAVPRARTNATRRQTDRPYGGRLGPSCPGSRTSVSADAAPATHRGRGPIQN